MKFRAWDKKNKMLLPPEHVVGLYPHIGIIVVHLFDCDGYVIDQDERYMDEFDVMQYTGLKDMRGKEIWEKDIVEDSEKRRGIVRYENGCYVVMYENGCRELLHNCHNKVKIVGNIYEGVR